MVLSFGGSQTEVTLATGGIEELQERAEADFGLVAGSYNFFDLCGKVEGATALERALRFAAEGPCMLEVRERAEWQKIRLLEARIEEVAAQQKQSSAAVPVASPAPEDLARLAEEHVMAKVDAALAELGGGLQQIDAKVNGALGTFVQTLAFSQMDMKAKLDGIDIEALTSRIDGLESTLAAARALAREPIGLQSLRIPACKLDIMSDQDAQPMSPSFFAGQRSPAAAGGGGTGQGGKLGRTSALGSDVPAARFQRWQDGGMPKPVLGLTGAKAWHHTESKGEPTATAPFVRCIAPQQLQRKPLSRSTPLLPPVF